MEAPPGSGPPAFADWFPGHDTVISSFSKEGHFNDPWLKIRREGGFEPDRSWLFQHESGGELALGLRIESDRALITSASARAWDNDWPVADGSAAYSPGILVATAEQELGDELITETGTGVWTSTMVVDGRCADYDPDDPEWDCRGYDLRGPQGTEPPAGLIVVTPTLGPLQTTIGHPDGDVWIMTHTEH